MVYFSIQMYGSELCEVAPLPDFVLSGAGQCLRAFRRAKHFSRESRHFALRLRWAATASLSACRQHATAMSATVGSIRYVAVL
jgi:hypothetical protein